MALDRDMARVYAAALRKAAREHPPMLKAGQRGWIKGRNDCWKAADPRTCAVESYRRRIVELQAWYRLVPASPPVRLVCGDSAADELVLTHFQTDPPTLVAERGDQSSLMFLERGADGDRYVGRNESLRERPGEVTVVWGYQAPELRCRSSPTDIVSPLARSAWKLVAIQSMDDTQGTQQVARPERFTLRLDLDGRARLRIDCLQASTGWTSAPSGSPGSGSLTFGPLPAIRKTCGPASLDRRVLRDLPHVRSYLLRDGRLYLSLMADGGILAWAPLAGP